jgi:hypothetical protein
VSAKGALLRHTPLLVPKNGAIRTCLNQLFVSFRLYRIDEDDAVVPLNNCAFAGFDAGCAPAMHAGDWEIGYINFGELASFLRKNIDPPVAMSWLRDRVRQKVIVNKLILAGQEAVIAFLTSCNINDQIPVFHITVHSTFLSVPDRNLKPCYGIF